MTLAATELDLLHSPGKMIVTDLLNRLPEEATLDEIAEEILLIAALRQSAIADAQGRGMLRENLVRAMRQFDSEKSRALEIVARMPGSSTYEEIREELDVLIAVREGDEDSDADRVFSHDEVKRIIASCTT